MTRLYWKVRFLDSFRSSCHERAIHEYLTHYNQQPKPFVWTKGADTILAKIDRCKEALNAPH